MLTIDICTYLHNLGRFILMFSKMALIFLQE